jgi:succinate dehydrogenase/fumarate reductase flavoprotein subunit
MRHAYFDVIVIGSGAAGLRAALSVRAAGLTVGVVSKGRPGKSTCTGYSGGVMAGSDGADKRHAHLRNTLTAGRGLNEVSRAEILVAEAPLRINELREWGIRADVRHGYLYAQGHPPTLGMEIVRCLVARNEEGGTQFYSGLTVTDVMVRNGTAGVCAYAASSNDWLTLGARTVVIATGGGAALFLRNDNPKSILGDGWRLALEAGAELQDMEFVQFYPLCLSEPGAAPLVIPPRLADRGRLINDAGEDLLEKYMIAERPAGERARDRLAQALFREIHRSGRTVRLDLRDVSEEEWHKDPFGASLQGLLLKRYGAGKRPLRVAPAAHHSMGGVRVDADGATSVPGLFAAGEAAGGLHGANRMGGNALSEALVFGARAGSAAAAYAASLPAAERQAIQKPPAEGVAKQAWGSRPGAVLKEELKKIMWEDGGIIRDAKGLSRALAAVQAIRNEASLAASRPAGKELLDLIEVRSAAQIAGIILEAAFRRQESRGAHFREDFPEQDDEKWQGHLLLRLGSGGEPVWRFEPKHKAAVWMPPRADNARTAGPR